MAERKAVLIRIDPRVHAALERWARDDLRSVNAQIEFLLREGLRRAGRLDADRRTGGQADSVATDRRAGGPAGGGDA